MSTPEAPRLDPRRTAAFSAELHARAQAWIPAWGLADAEGDFGRALLEIAARFSSEVAERLDGAGEKMRRGFLDWLAVRGQPARPARMPVVFKPTDAAQASVLAEAPVRLQADAAGTSVVFETETSVRVVPGRLDVLVGIDADNDAFYLAPPGLDDLQPLAAAPTRWQPKSFAAAGATKLQLDPEGGLVEGTIIDAGGQQYRVTQVDKDLVAIEPPLASELGTTAIVSKVDRFTPFEGTSRNWQAHALYFGDPDLLNIEAAATIDIIGTTALREGVTWQYWGTVDGSEAVGWQPLALAAADEQQKATGVLLEKPKGAVEILPIAGRSSRWIRAFRATSEQPITANEFTIRINATACNGGAPACPPDSTAPSPVAEGMANSTPLVLENVFFPLGREPRQFDAFYLGSQEVFSKPHAQVQLCFEMADPSFDALALLRTGAPGDQTLAGVAADGHLHVLTFEAATGRLRRFAGHDPLRPAEGTPVTLDRRPPFRPALWVTGTDFHVAVTAGNVVWEWHEHIAAPSQSAWISRGSVEAATDASIRTMGLVHLADAPAGRLFALRQQRLYVRDLNVENDAWQLVPARRSDDNSEVQFDQIAPIAVEAQNLAATLDEGLVGVGADGVLYAVTLAGTPLEGTCTELLTDVETTVAPAAVRRADNRLLAVAIDGNPAAREFRAFLSTVNGLAQHRTDAAAIDWPDATPPEIVGHSIDLTLRGGAFTFAACVRNSESSAVAAWGPLFSASDTPAYITTIPAAVGVANGAPTLVREHVLVPTSAGEVIVASFDPALRAAFVAPTGTAVITSAEADRLAADDIVAFRVDQGGTPAWDRHTISSPGVAHGGKRYHAFNTPAIDDRLLVYRDATASFDGSIPDDTALDELQLDALDDGTGEGTVLLIATDLSTELYTVDDFSSAPLVVLDRDLNVSDATQPIIYKVPDVHGAQVRPTLRLNPATNGHWDATLLGRTRLQFPGAEPLFQEGTAFTVDAGHPERVALGAMWSTPPADLGAVQFIVDASVGTWSRQLSDSSANPDLSWEYWNGTGWWTLGSVEDDTLNLKRSGGVRFDVPSDLRETDVSGKTNHWVRARLIGGDYGQEKVTVTTTDLGGGKTEQTVERSTDGIRAPSVLALHLSYALCDAVRPTFVLAEDSGSTRDQSDANRTPGAIVEAFVPLSVMLGRLSGESSTSKAPAEECPPGCRCGETEQGAAQRAVEPTEHTPSTPATGRFVLLGLDAALSGAPVNVLLLVQERDHSALAPMAVEALVADRFQPIVADDTTRALGESGVLSMAFDVRPAARELFGRTRTWLQLRPAARASDTSWAPTLRGAYLNAAWASATETLTRELLGSSEGAPDITLRLARPPVLNGTLELRVREPLGDEERAALLEQGAHRVRGDVGGLPGDWVLWDQVIDPADEPPHARVYALDEAIGEVRFGDGLHGMIPPIGRDSIVAFSYQRTEPGTPGSDSVPANAIAARTPLNLVSPVESVEAVVAADHAAGGAPPESAERVLRFGSAGLRHRGRLVTARDVEDLALQSSPDIVQARALPARGHLRLVVVIKGRDPQPAAAQVRELRRLLLEAAPAPLAEPTALRISGPSVRRLRVDLELRTASLDHAGALAEAVTSRLAAFFDTEIGGPDHRGWPIGVSPSDDDIALALIDAPHLTGIAGVALREILADGRDDRPWPPTLTSIELAMLADDAVRIRFAPAEVSA